jgi:hypothetical protein
MDSLEFSCQERDIDFSKEDNHIRCLAHVINLAAQDALTTLKIGYFENENEILSQAETSDSVILKVIYYIIYIFLKNNYLFTLYNIA